MKQLFTILLILIQFISLSQIWPTEKENLNGKVKHLIINSITYISEYEEDWLKQDQDFYYNEQGFLYKGVNTVDFYGISQSGLFRMYDKLGTYCLIEYELNEKDTISETKFIYDSLNRITQKKYQRKDINFNNTFYDIYDLKGNLIREFSIPDNNDTISKIYVYDNLNRKIKETDTSYSCVIIKSWKYDLTGNLIEEKSELKKAPKTIIVNMGKNGVESEKTLTNNTDDDRNYQIIYYYNNFGNLYVDLNIYLVC
jgi:hypothetical protein